MKESISDAIGLYEEDSSTIDEKNPYKVMANDGRPRTEMTSQISEESRNNHQTLIRLLGSLPVKFLVRKQANLRRTLKEHDFYSSSSHEKASKGFSKNIHVQLPLDLSDLNRFSCMSANKSLPKH